MCILPNQRLLRNLPIEKVACDVNAQSHRRAKSKSLNAWDEEFCSGSRAREQGSGRAGKCNLLPSLVGALFQLELVWLWLCLCLCVCAIVCVFVRVLCLPHSLSSLFGLLQLIYLFLLFWIKTVEIVTASGGCLYALLTSRASVNLFLRHELEKRLRSVYCWQWLGFLDEILAILALLLIGLGVVQHHWHLLLIASCLGRFV